MQTDNLQLKTTHTSSLNYTDTDTKFSHLLAFESTEHLERNVHTTRKMVSQEEFKNKAFELHREQMANVKLEEFGKGRVLGQRGEG